MAGIPKETYPSGDTSESPKSGEQKPVPAPMATDVPVAPPLPTLPPPEDGSGTIVQRPALPFLPIQPAVVPASPLNSAEGDLIERLQGLTEKEQDEEEAKVVSFYRKKYKKGEIDEAKFNNRMEKIDTIHKMTRENLIGSEIVAGVPRNMYLQGEDQDVIRKVENRGAPRKIMRETNKKIIENFDSASGEGQIYRFKSSVPLGDAILPPPISGPILNFEGKPMGKVKASEEVKQKIENTVKGLLKEKRGKPSLPAHGAPASDGKLNLSVIKRVAEKGTEKDPDPTKVITLQKKPDEHLVYKDTAPPYSPPVNQTGSYAPYPMPSYHPAPSSVSVSSPSGKGSGINIKINNKAVIKKYKAGRDIKIKKKKTKLKNSKITKIHRGNKTKTKTVAK